MDSEGVIQTLRQILWLNESTDLRKKNKRDYVESKLSQPTHHEKSFGWHNRLNIFGTSEEYSINFELYENNKKIF